MATVLVTVLVGGRPAHAREAACARVEDPGEPAGSIDAAETAVAPTPASSDSPAAAPADEGSLAESLGRTPRRVKCLDESLIDEFGRASARKGVQPRDFRKARRLSISIQGGGRGGDLLDTQWHGGASLAFWPTEDFGFDAQFDVSPMTLRIERSTTSFFGTNRFADGVVRNLSYAAIGHLMFSPIHTKLRARGDRIIHGDFVLVGGAGAVLHRSVQAAAFDLGMSLYLYPAKFVSLRLDLTDRIMAQEALGQRRIANDLVFSFGVGLWIPFRRRAP